MSNKNDDHFYIEKRPNGEFAASRGGADRASAITNTQGEAIDRARKIDPSAPVHVERVRNTNRGRPDEWRKP